MSLRIEIEGRQYDVDSLPDGAIREAGKYHFIWEEERDNTRPDDYRLVVSDISLRASYFYCSGNMTEIRWLWEPEFFAGSFYPMLYYQGKKVWPQGGSGEIVVDADGKKLTQDQFRKMVADISEVSQIAFSLSPAYSKTELAKGKTFSLAQMEMMIIYLDDILKTVEAIARNPKKKLFQFRREVPLYQSKQSDEPAVLKLIINPTGYMRPEKVNVSTALRRVTERTNGILFDKIPEVDNRISYNTYENAFVKGFLKRLLIAARQIEKQLDLLSSGGLDEPQAVIAASRKEKMKRHRRFIQKTIEMPFLREVTPLKMVDRYTVTMAKHPDYRKLYQYYLKFLQTAAPLGYECLNLSLDRTYQLYEYWCFMKIAGYLMKNASEQDVDASELFAFTNESGGISLRLKHGEQSRVKINSNLSLYFQRQYNYIHDGTIGSYSFRMIPDIVIEQKNEDGSKTIVVLDPKYRVGYSAIQSALGDMHKYKDAIVDQDGNKIIKAAFILVPKQPESNGDSSRYLDNTYRKNYGFGVFVLTPGEDNHLKQLFEMLCVILAPACFATIGMKKSSSFYEMARDFQG